MRQHNRKFAGQSNRRQMENQLKIEFKLTVIYLCCYFSSLIAFSVFGVATKLIQRDRMFLLLKIEKMNTRSNLKNSVFHFHWLSMMLKSFVSVNGITVAHSMNLLFTQTHRKKKKIDSYEK